MSFVDQLHVSTMHGHHQAGRKEDKKRSQPSYSCVYIFFFLVGSLMENVVETCNCSEHEKYCCILSGFSLHFRSQSAYYGLLFSK
jgi:hypothetical protein